MELKESGVKRNIKNLKNNEVSTPPPPSPTPKKYFLIKQ